MNALSVVAVLFLVVSFALKASVCDVHDFGAAGDGRRKDTAAFEAAIAAFPGLILAGAGYHGVGLPDCLRQGLQAAHECCVRGSSAGIGLRMLQTTPSAWWILRA